jgi:diguanylate cyclase (GGDEF)-like protein
VSAFPWYSNYPKRGAISRSKQKDSHFVCGLLHDRLGRILATTRREGSHGALMFLDLDNFKPLNDTHGHEVGEQLLVEVARRLNDCVRDTDSVARFG